MGNMEFSRKHFEWKFFWRATYVFLIDLLLTAFVVAALWCFAYYVVFGGCRILASAKEVAEITDALAWPCAVLLLFLMVRNPLLRILNEVPSFVSRSYVRQGGEVKDPGRGSESLDEKSSSQENGAKTTKDEHSLRKVALSLERQFGGMADIEKCIGSRRYVFDIVVDCGDRIYGVEVKSTCESSAWERVFARVQSMYDGYHESLKRKFVFVAMVIGEASEEDELKLLRLGQRWKFITRIEIKKECV